MVKLIRKGGQFPSIVIYFTKSEKISTVKVKEECELNTQITEESWEESLGNISRPSINVRHMFIQFKVIDYIIQTAFVQIESSIFLYL